MQNVSHTTSVNVHKYMYMYMYIHVYCTIFRHAVRDSSFCKVERYMYNVHVTIAIITIVSLHVYSVTMTLPMNAQQEQLSTVRFCWLQGKVGVAFTTASMDVALVCALFLPV